MVKPGRIALATLAVTVVALSGAAVRVSAAPGDDVIAQAAAVADTLDKLQSQIYSLDEDFAQASAAQDQLTQDIEAATADVAAAEARVAEVRGTLYLSAVTQFMSGGRSSTLGTLLASTGSLQDALQREGLTAVAVNAGALTTDELETLSSDLQKKKSALEKKKAQVQAAAADVLARQKAAEALSAKYQEIQSSLSADVAAALRAEQQRRNQQTLQQSEQLAQQWQSQYNNAQSQYKNIPKVSARAQTAINAALSQLGTPYSKNPRLSPGVGFDCSGLMIYAWGRAGVGLPGSSRAQYAGLPHVPKELAKPGDLIFQGNPIHHVGLYLGGGRMVHSPQTGDVVKISAITWDQVTGVARPG